MLPKKRRTVQRSLKRGVHPAEIQTPSPKRYKIVAVSLYLPDAESVEKAKQSLSAAGEARASRSLVVQTAIRRLTEELAGKSPAEVRAYFAKYRIRREPAFLPARLSRQRLRSRALR